MSNTPAPGQRRRTINLVWLAAYLTMLAAVVVGVLYARQVTLREFDTPEARAEWQDWREAEPNRSAVGGVSRRPPKSTEPPALVLMRDHFVVVMAAAVVFSSLLFAALMITARGAFSPAGPKQRTAGLG
jgi:hypothetical protein